ncbi:S-layer homology domain-containing protein [Syntrophomonas erecta]
MKKIFTAALSLIMVFTLSGGMALAKPDSSTPPGQQNKVKVQEKKQTQSEQQTTEKKAEKEAKQEAKQELKEAKQAEKEASQAIKQELKEAKQAEKEASQAIKQELKETKQAEKEQNKAGKAPGQQKFKVNQKIQAQFELQTDSEQQVFTDTNNHWAKKSVSKLIASGLFKGYPDGTFKPDRPITQAETISLIMRLVNEDNENDEDIQDEDTNIEEKDKDILEWVRGAYSKAAHKGIINLNRFHSQVQADRATAVVWIAKSLELTPVDVSELPFKDGILLSKEDVGYIMAAYEAGIISGTPSGKFNPNSAITRAEIASIMERILSGQEPAEDAVPVKVEITGSDKVVQGETVQLTAKVTYSDGTNNKDVSWESDDSTLATVKDGLVTASDDKTGTVTIIAKATRNEVSKSARYEITVVEKEEVVEGTLDFTGNIGTHDGKVYQEYALEVDDKTISLKEDNVKSITLAQNDKMPVVLTPNTDSSLWFNVQKESGNYTLTVTDKEDTTYTAVLKWKAPLSVDAIATGSQGKQDGNSYLEYRLGDLDLSSFTKMYQIKPDGKVSELTPNTDTNLWFKVNDQQEGSHVFLIKQDGTWYTATIEYKAEN